MLSAAPVLFALAAFAPTDSPSTDQLLGSAVEHAMNLELEQPDELDAGACQGEPAAASSSGRGGPLGLGIQLGWPTGLAGMYRLGGNMGIQFGVGFGGGALIVGSADLVFRLAELVRVEPGVLSFYLGIGAYIGLFPTYYGFYNYLPFPLAAGVEVPLGLTFDLSALPLDIFLEIAPVVGLVPGIGVGFKGTLGARYYF